MTFNGLLFLRHDLLLTAMSVLIYGAACLCALRLRQRLRFGQGAARAVWLALGGAVVGAGAWAAEFLQLAGFDPGAAAGFDPATLLAALLVSAGGSALALALGWTRGGPVRAVAGGLALTTAFAGMRLFALISYKSDAHAVWQPALICVANGLSAAAAVGAFRLRGRALRTQIASAGLMGLSLWTIQVITSAAATLTLHQGPGLAPGLLTPQVVVFLAVMIAAVTILCGLGAAYIDTAAGRTAVLRSRRLADAAGEGILVVSEGGLVLDANAAAAAMAGRPVEALQRRPLNELLEFDRPLEPGEPVESVLRAADGEAIPVEVHARPLHHRGEREESTSVVVLRDLRERRAVEQRLRFLSEHDPLTGLPNRAALRRMVEAHVDVGALLLFVRVLNHAETNSLLGHAAGDAVLEKLGERLKRMATGETRTYACMAARLGGAEFAFAAGGEMQAASAFPRDFARVLARPIVLDGHVVEPQIRVGVACAPLDSGTADELFRHAEAALEVATRSDPSDSVIYFRQDLQDDLKARRTLIHELRNGIAADELVVHYQPQARTRDGRLCGFEALVRWMHPIRGLMPPDSFIPLAEESGLIVGLGEYVLRRACADAVTWPAPVPVAVNLSPLQVHQTDLPRLVHAVLLETGLPPARLELEITEGALFRDFQRALDTLRRIKGLGVKITMDDFGTGFSSLSTLQSFPFDKIKIDKSFVGAGDERASVIVKAVLGIGRGLDIPVVAEGVETPEQMAFLREEGCEVVQGYLIGRPGPVETHAVLFESLTGLAPEPKPSPRRAA